jgi:hypothetical protein
MEALGAGNEQLQQKLNREDAKDLEENIFCGLRGSRFCRITR